MRIANGHCHRLDGIDDGRGDGGVGFDVIIMGPGTLIRMIRIPAAIVIILSFKGSVFPVVRNSKVRLS